MPVPGSSRVLGLDGCSGGWVGVVWDGDSQVEVVRAGLEQLEGLIDSIDRLAGVGIDVPIGTEQGRFRSVDAEAKKLLRERCGHARASSVFPTPPRAVLTTEPHPQATALCSKLTGRGISQQSYALRHRILYVEGVADRLGELVFEVHPEVSFSEMGGPGGPVFGKRSWNGQTERRELLNNTGIALPEKIDDEPIGKLPVDDILDAAAAAWSAARVVGGRAESLPSGAKRSDRRVIWY